MNYALFTSDGPIYPGNTMQIPRFSIYTDKQGKKVSTLQHCFIERVKLSRTDLPANICAKDGKVYSVVYDCQIPKDVEEFEAIISFQQHTYGRFAVVRIATR